MPEQTGYIFISHSHMDGDFARDIKHALEDAGFRTWLDEDDIDPAARWVTEIEKAVENCGALLAIMSHQARKSEWVEREILFAQDLKKPVFTVRIDDVRLPIYLIDKQYVDYTTRPAAAFKKLVAALKKVTFAAPPPEPVGPVNPEQLTPEPNWTQFHKYIRQGPGGAQAADVARALYDWARRHADSIAFSGSEKPAMHVHVRLKGGAATLFSVWAYARQPKAEVPLMYLRGVPPYDQRAQRVQVVERLNTLLPPDARFTPDRADRLPAVPLAGALDDADQQAAFLALMAEMAAALRAGQAGGA